MRARNVLSPNLRTGFCSRCSQSRVRFVRSTSNKKSTHKGPPGRCPKGGTIFAYEIARERQSSFSQKCEPDPVQQVARCPSDEGE